MIKQLTSLAGLILLSLSAQADYLFKLPVPGIKPATCALPWDGSIPNNASVTAYAQNSVAYNEVCQSETRVCSNGQLLGAYTYSACSVQPGLSCSLPWGGNLPHGNTITAYSATSVTEPSSCMSVAETRTCTNGVLSGQATNATCSVQTTTGDGSTKTGACTTNCASLTTWGSTLTVTSGTTVNQQQRAWASAYANMCKSSGKWYWEVTHSGGPDAINAVAGVTYPTLKPLTDTPIAYSPTPPGIKVWASQWNWYDPSTTDQGILWGSFANKTTGIALNLDNKTVSLYQNGGSIGTANLPTYSAYCPFVSALAWNYSADSTTLTTNFGQSTFKMAPPIGFNRGVW